MLFEQQLLAMAASLVLAVCLFGWLAGRGVRPKEVETWARAFGVPLDRRTRPVVTYYVRLTAVLRVAGGASGLVLSGLVNLAFGVEGGGYGMWLWVIAGWTAGAAWAERCLPRPPGPAATASLTPRRIADYLPFGLRWAPAAGAALAVGMAFVGAVDEAGETGPGLALDAVGAVAVAGLVAWGQRAVVGRRQPVTHPDLVRADDAVRASTVHNLGGGGAALTLLIAAHAAEQLRQLGGGAIGSTPLLLGLAALVAWRFYAHRAWRVRRPAPAAVGAQP